MIEIDGSYGEGGGQVLRTSVGLSAVIGEPCRIFNIRSGRCNPGLRSQHLKGIEAVTEICKGKLKGAKIGSTCIEFFPGKIRDGNYKINVGTAGSITLVLQTLVIPSLHANKEISFEIIGGTHVRWSPSVDYFQHVFCYYMEKLGVDISFEIKQYGFYPKGGGKVFVKVKPKNQNNHILTERGDYKKIDILSIASENLRKPKVAERQIEGFEKIIEMSKNKNIKYIKAISTGSAITAFTEYDNCIIGSCSIGEAGKKSEDVGKECAEILKKEMDSDAPIDEYMADQILPYLAMSRENSKIKVAEITGHVKTNIWVLEKFLPVKFKIDENKKIIFCNVE